MIDRYRVYNNRYVMDKKTGFIISPDPNHLAAYLNNKEKEINKLHEKIEVLSLQMVGDGIKGNHDE